MSVWAPACCAFNCKRKTFRATSKSLTGGEKNANLAVQQGVKLALQLGDDLEEVLTFGLLHLVLALLELIAEQAQHGHLLLQIFGILLHKHGEQVI